MQIRFVGDFKLRLGVTVPVCWLHVITIADEKNY